ncbi:MAG TPA: hypothetical protein VJ998_12470, partial [Pseudomonadales bacterium]|nr:hypothetical protein [Pseudomonadales bacterium]
MKWNFLLLALALALSAGADMRTGTTSSVVASQQRGSGSSASQPLLARFLWGEESRRSLDPGTGTKGFREEVDKDVSIDGGRAPHGATASQTVLEGKGTDVANGRNVVAGLQFDPRNLEGTDRDVSNLVRPGGPGILEGTDRDVTSHPSPHSTEIRKQPPAGEQVVRYLWDNNVHRKPAHTDLRVARYLWGDGVRRRSDPRAEPRIVRYLWQDGLDTHNPSDEAGKPYLWQDAADALDSAEPHQQVARYLWGDGVRGKQAPAKRQVARYLWGDGVRSNVAPAKRQVARYLWGDDARGKQHVGDMQLARYLWGDGIRKDRPVGDRKALNRALAMFLWRDDRATRVGAAEDPHYYDTVTPEYTTNHGAPHPKWDVADSYQAIASAGRTMVAPRIRDFIVVGHDLGQLKRHIHALGASVSADLALINGVGTTLTRRQMLALQHDPNVVSIVADRA